MKIKLKVKQLVYLVLGLLLAIPLVTMFIQPQVQLFVGKQQLEKGEVEGKVKILESLENSILPNQKWGIIKTYMLDGGFSDRFDVYVGPSSTQVNHQGAEMRFTPEEKLPYLKEYLANGPGDGYLTNAARQLVYFYQREGELEKADEVLQQAVERFARSPHMGHLEELQLERVKMFIKQADYARAKELIDELKTEFSPENDYWRAELAKSEAEVIIKEGNVEEAYKIVVAQIKDYERQLEKEKREFPEHEIGTPVVLEQLESLKSHLETAIERQAEGMTKVKGHVVRSDGTPVAHAGVFLRQKDDVNHSVVDGEPYQLVTDKEGNFEFTGVIPGSYQLYLGLNFDQIDGWTWPIQPHDWIEVAGETTKTIDVTLHPLLELHTPVNQAELTTDTVRFAWEEVEGAAYYDLSLGIELESGSIGSSFKTKITENELTVPMEELYDKTVGMTFEDTEDWSSVDPISILAFTNTENRFFWSVQAFDADGKMITQSNGYRLNEDSIGNLPFFYLKVREMTEADRLFLDKKVEQAFERYKADYENNPNDRHSLRMIVRLMGIEAAQTGKTRDEAALPYLIKWAELSLSAEDAFDLAKIYFEKRDWANYQHWYEKYLHWVEGAPSEYTLGIHATALMKQGKIPEAQAAFKQVMEQDQSNRFIGHWLAVELHAGQSFDSVIELARKYPERDGGANEDWAGMIRKLAEEEAETGDHYRQEVSHALELYFNGQLEEELETTSHKHLTQFLQALESVN